MEKQFDTVVKVEGFSRDMAEKYAFRILKDKRKVRQLLEFRPRSDNDGLDLSYVPDLESEGDRRDEIREHEVREDPENEHDTSEYERGDDSRKGQTSHLYKVPILLSIMCYLVKTDKEADDLFLKPDHKGLIYFRMVRCVYRTFCEKQEKEFDGLIFKKTVVSVGRLAWQTLLSGDPMLRKGDVLRELGSEAFCWGMFIGDEDAENLTDESADVLITFVHRSIQEFFGALYFILSLSEGKSIDGLLGDHSENPIFVENSLFLEFCLWLMYTLQKKCSLLDKTEQMHCRAELGRYILPMMDTKVSMIPWRSIPAFETLGWTGNNEMFRLFLKEIFVILFSYRRVTHT